MCDPKYPLDAALTQQHFGNYNFEYIETSGERRKYQSTKQHIPSVISLYNAGKIGLEGGELFCYLGEGIISGMLRLMDTMLHHPMTPQPQTMLVCLGYCSHPKP